MDKAPCDFCGKPKTKDMRFNMGGKIFSLCPECAWAVAYKIAEKCCEVARQE